LNWSAKKLRYHNLRKKRIQIRGCITPRDPLFSTPLHSESQCAGLLVRSGGNLWLTVRLRACFEAKQFERRRHSCNILPMASPPPLRADTQARFFLKRWNDFLADPELLRRPERIEIDAFGHFLMSPPPDALHRKRGFRITALLEALLPGDGAYPEQPILTSEGVRIADVIWINPSRLHELSGAPNQPLSPAPDICVEILPPSNTQAEIDRKCALYFAAGAREVWICDRDNQIRFFLPQGQVERSTLCPKFPRRIELFPKAVQA
jgi:Uma2 family endonuclease